MITVNYYEITNKSYHINKTNLDFINKIKKKYEYVNEYYTKEQHEHKHLNTLLIYDYNCDFSELNLNVFDGLQRHNRFTKHSSTRCIHHGWQWSLG